MATIRRQIAVDAAPSVVAATWSRFIEWAHHGPSRLACDELACVDAVRAGLVSFEPSATGRTTVTFSIDPEPGGPAAELLGHQLGHDLVVFKDYMERSGNRVGKPTPREEREMVAAEGRREHRPNGETQSERDESIAYTDHFPT
jgi:hypothetical protein